jgi:hypothetical protein
MFLWKEMGRHGQKPSSVIRKVVAVNVLRDLPTAVVIESKDLSWPNNASILFRGNSESGFILGEAVASPKTAIT